MKPHSREKMEEQKLKEKINRFNNVVIEIVFIIFFSFITALLILFKT